MSSDNPYGGPYPGQPGQGPVPGQGGTPSGQPSAGGPYGYPQQPPAGGPPPGSGYTFGPFAPGSQPGGPQGAPPPGSYGAPPPPGYPPQPRRSQPPGGPPNRSKTRIIIIAAAAVVVLALGTTGIVLANRDDPGATRQPSAPQSQVADPSQTAAAPPSEPPTSAPPPTTAPAAAKASDAVAGYLKALAAADADAAIAYSAEPLTKGGTLTDSVLAESNKRAPLRGINVPAVDDENAATVDATYKLGKKTVSESFDVVKSGSDWKLQRVVADLNLAGVRYKGVTLRLNGAKVSRNVVSVFPGSYALTSGRKTVSYGSKNTVVVRGPSDLPSTTGIKLSLTHSGTKSVKNAAKRSYSNCLKQKKVAPKGCPFGLTTGSFKINNSTIKWTQKGSDPFRNAKVSLVSTLATVRIKINVEMNADCTSNGRAATCSGGVNRAVGAYVSAVKPSGKVTWAAM